MVNTQEYLSEDILEQEYIGMYKLVNCAQMILGSCRVHVKDRFVTSPSFYQKLYTIMCLTISTMLFVLNVKINFSKFYEYNTIYYLSIFGTVLDLSSYICNVFHVRFMNGESNSELYLKLQKIDRLMKIDRNKVMNSLFYRVNVITIVFIVSVLVLMLTGIWIRGNLSYLYFFGWIWSEITFLLEIVNCSNIVLYFFIRMRFVNSIIKNHIYPIKSDEHLRAFSRMMATKKLMRHVASTNHDFKLSATDLYLNEIFDGFEKFQNVYKFQIFIFCGKLVLVTLVGFEFILFAVQRNLLKLVEISMLVSYHAIDFLTALFLSIRCEMFFKEVKEMKRLSIGVMLRYQEGPLRDKARKMLKMIEESPPCFSVYDMWQLDAHIFVKIFGLVTTLMVTLLQFALL